MLALVLLHHVLDMQGYKDLTWHAVLDDLISCRLYYRTDTCMAGHCPPPPGTVGKPGEGSGMGWGLLSNMWTTNMWTYTWEDKSFCARTHTAHVEKHKMRKRLNNTFHSFSRRTEKKCVCLQSCTQIATRAGNTCPYRSQWWGLVPAGGCQAEVGYSSALWLCWFYGETFASSAASFWSERRCVFSCGLMYERSYHSEGRGKDEHLGTVKRNFKKLLEKLLSLNRKTNNC